MNPDWFPYGHCEDVLTWDVCDWCGEEIERHISEYPRLWGLMLTGPDGEKYYAQICPACADRLFSAINGIKASRESEGLVNGES